MSTGDDDIIGEFNLEDEENRLKRIIGRIEKNRNRACYQNILSFAKRENTNLEMETIKDVIKGMIDKNIIFNKGKDEIDKESFKMFQTDADHAEFSTQTQNGVEDDDERFETYINDKFIETLKSLIKSEVDSFFCEQNRALNRLSVPDKIMKEGNNYNNESLVKTLNDHISFFAKRTAVKRHYN